MTLALPRRRFLSLLGLGAAAAGVEIVAPEPVRRWFVASNAPVGLPPVLRGQPDMSWLGDTPWLKAMLDAARAPKSQLGEWYLDDTPEAREWLTERDRAGRTRADHMALEGEMRDWLGPKAADEWDRDAYHPEEREPWEEIFRSALAPGSKQRIDAEFSECVREAGKRIRAASSDGQPLFSTVEEWARNGTGPKPIGTVESIDPVTGIATVRLHAPLAGWRGVGTA